MHVITDVYPRCHVSCCQPNAASSPDHARGQDERKTCVERLRDRLRVEVVKLDEEEVVFDLIGADPSLANALRRILIAEVRTSVCFDGCG
jgi:hypothetical protein